MQPQRPQRPQRPPNATSSSGLSHCQVLIRRVDHGFGLLDVQWQTDHLASLGTVEIPQAAYLSALYDAVRLRTTWPEMIEPERLPGTAEHPGS